LSLPHPEAEGFVLAGGKSSRMGQEKALIQLAGRPLIQHAIDIVQAAGLTAKIAGSRADLSAFAETLPDQPGQSGLGPLAGVCSALSVSKCRFGVFVPVDLPLIPPALMRYLVEQAIHTNSAVSVISVDSFVQTFPVAIDRATLPALNRTLVSGDRNCLKAFRSAALAIDGPFTTLQIDPPIQFGRLRHQRNIDPKQWFLNINTPQDLALAEATFSGSDRFK